EDGDAYLAVIRVGELPSWGMDDQPLTETAEEWAARVRARLDADAARDEEAAPVAAPATPAARLEAPQPAASPDAATCTRAFPGLPESVSAARLWVAGFFPDPAAAADAALMTSELVTNAIKYTACCLPGGEVLVSVRAGQDQVRVDVTDQGSVYPCFPVPSGLALGLVLVRQLP